MIIPDKNHPSFLFYVTPKRAKTFSLVPKVLPLKSFGLFKSNKDEFNRTQTVSSMYSVVIMYFSEFFNKAMIKESLKTTIVTTLKVFADNLSFLGLMMLENTKI